MWKATAWTHGIPDRTGWGGVGWDGAGGTGPRAVTASPVKNATNCHQVSVENSCKQVAHTSMCIHMHMHMHMHAHAHVNVHAREGYLCIQCVRAHPLGAWK